MFDHYREEAGIEGDTFLADYARLGAQRNAKIVGIFVRLWKRDQQAALPAAYLARVESDGA